MDVDGKPLPATALTPEETKATQEQINKLNGEIELLTMKIQAEEEKFRTWKQDNLRRKHNYIPFLVNMLKLLAEKGELIPLVQKAKEKQQTSGKRGQPSN